MPVSMSAAKESTLLPLVYNPAGFATAFAPAPASLPATPRPLAPTTKSPIPVYQRPTALSTKFFLILSSFHKLTVSRFISPLERINFDIGLRSGTNSDFVRACIAVTFLLRL